MIQIISNKDHCGCWANPGLDLFLLLECTKIKEEGNIFKMTVFTGKNYNKHLHEQTVK